MKKLFLLFSIFVAAITIATAQSVSIAATNGGSITLTPSGVERVAPTKVVPKGIQTQPKLKGVGDKGVDTKPVLFDSTKISVYPIADLGIEDARIVRNCLASTAYEENANPTDWKAFNDVRSYILANKDFKNSTKKISILVSPEKLDCILSSSSGGGWYGQNEKQIQEAYDRSMRGINLKKKVIAQAETEESKKRISPDNSAIRRYKNSDQ